MCDLPGTGVGSVANHQAHRLGTGLRVLLHQTTHRGRDGTRAGLLDPSHRHAHVLAVQYHDDTTRHQRPHQQIRDLRGQPLLYLRPAAVYLDQPGELGQPSDPPVGPRDVPDVCDAAKRQQMVFTQREELDVAYQDELLVACLESGGQHIGRIDPQAGEEFRVATRDARRSPAQTLPVRVFTNRDQDLPYRPLDPIEIDRIGDRPSGQFTVDQPRGEVVELGMIELGMIELGLVELGLVELGLVELGVDQDSR